MSLLAHFISNALINYIIIIYLIYLIFPHPVHIILLTISSPTPPSVSAHTVSKAPSPQIAESATLVSLHVGGHPLINQLVPHLPDLRPLELTVHTLLV